MTDLEARLADLAAQGKTMTYGALARDLGWRVSELTDALERLMEEDAAAGAPNAPPCWKGACRTASPPRASS
jgi:hypothetical protein